MQGNALYKDIGTVFGKYLTDTYLTKCYHHE